MTSRKQRDDEAHRQDTVFVRTLRGELAMRSPDSDLPRRLRPLLMAVDGQSTMRTLQVRLPNYASVGTLLDVLQSGGYIAPAGTAGAAAAPSRIEPYLASRNPSPWFESTLQFPDTDDDHDDSPEASQSPSSTDFSNSMPPHGGAPSLSGHRSTVTETARVRQAHTLMSEFLFENLPGIAMETVLGVERLDSTELLVASLPAYQRLVASTGRKGVEHLLAVRNILSL